ncbi:MAG: FecR domain-containing protein [Phenylobacterium sp.]|uniref:FecR family protein n=1 Tax=Phenylobacterium sp. TaxID=1871053 RepID=UPI00271D0438|nr:FecR domain-containing protein [Phenylobacterium sp.]MDO8409800.1 FecR domain-containing protein [Phenylobacterium sp.]
MNSLHPVFRDIGAAEDATDAAAALWLARDGAGWSPAEEAALQAWIAGDAAHAEAWAGIGEVMGLFDDPSAPELVPLRDQALRAAGSGARRPPVLTRRRLIGGGVGAGLAAAAAGLVVLQPQPAWRIYRAEPGARRSVALADGSQLTLDAGAEVRARFTDGRRDLILTTGQARFEVAKDPRRPFAVAVGDHLVVATGTAFNIEHDGHDAMVTLLEGRVEVRARRTGQVAARLRPGQGYRLAGGGEGVLIPQADVKQALAWTDGQLIFQDERLETAARRVSRYSPQRPIRVSPEAGDLRVSGVFAADDADAFVEAVSLYLPVAATRRPDGSVDLALRRAAAP